MPHLKIMWCPTNPPTGKRPFSPLPAKLIPVLSFSEKWSFMHVVVKARSLFIKNQGPEASRLDRGLSVWLNPARYHRIKFKLESRSSPELSLWQHSRVVGGGLRAGKGRKWNRIIPCSISIFIFFGNVEHATWNVEHAEFLPLPCSPFFLSFFFSISTFCIGSLQKTSIDCLVR